MTSETKSFPLPLPVCVPDTPENRRAWAKVLRATIEERQIISLKARVRLLEMELKEAREATQLKHWGKEKPDEGRFFNLYLPSESFPRLVERLPDHKGCPDYWQSDYGMTVAYIDHTLPDAIPEDALWAYAPVAPDWGEVEK